jgi:hypothetical protein
MPLQSLLVTPLVAMLVTGAVFTDTTRRGLEPRTRFRWTVGVGSVSLGGFLGVFAFDGVLFRAYAAVFGRPVIVQSPREPLALPFIVGLTLSLLAVLAYAVGSRVGPLAARVSSRR